MQPGRRSRGQQNPSSDRHSIGTHKSNTPWAHARTRLTHGRIMRAWARILTTELLKRGAEEREASPQILADPRGHGGGSPWVPFAASSRVIHDLGPLEISFSFFVGAAFGHTRQYDMILAREHQYIMPAYDLHGCSSVLSQPAPMHFAWSIWN